MKRPAFTLIELLVVIAIIGILATLVVVAVSGAQTRARNSQARSDVTQMGKAVMVFMTNNSSNQVIRVVRTGAPLTDSTLSGTTSSGSTPTIPNMFTGVESQTAPTYGIRISQTPSSQYTYTYRSNPSTNVGGNTGTATASGFAVITTNSVGDPSYCVTTAGSSVNAILGTSPCVP